jgi:hypothetical protein
MNNFAGCIEGATVNTGASDLKSRKTNGSEPSLVGGVGVPALGMLTITGSNMHRGIEMPVAQPYLLEVGRPACKCESFKGWGANEVTPPRLQSFYEKATTNTSIAK